jgi:uncharacterized protein
MLRALAARVRRRTAAMKNMGCVRMAPVGLALICAPSLALAASFNCNLPSLSAAQVTICQDAQLARSDTQTERRLIGLGRRMGFGQYLGLRHWQQGWAQRRDDCQTDRTCLLASYRAQGRFLDRLQQCLDNGLQRRACLRNTLNIEIEATRR